MLAQTNLQLYHEVQAAQWQPEELARLRRAWDLATQLFGGQYRPSGKPFVCHLVGVASCLVQWQQRSDLVIAGMLHSAYLYGDFGDGDHRASSRRRDYIQSVVGKAAESLIFTYQQNKRQSIFESTNSDCRIMVLADLVDELSDAGPRYADGKPIPELAKDHKDGASPLAQLLDLAEALIGEDAAQTLREAHEDFVDTEVHACLVRHERSSFRVEPGVVALHRNAVGRRMQKIAHRWQKKRSA